jgi:hypothetical protein
MRKILVKHVGNMGDMIFFVPPVLASLKKHYPRSHITFVTAWGLKDKKGRWGKRNQGGFCIELMMTNPHIDQLVHYHDTALALDGSICEEEGQHFPTWNKEYYEKQKFSGEYDGVYELDFGIGIEDNPMQKMYQAVGLPQESFTDYRLYLSESDKQVAQAVLAKAPHPRIVLLEGLGGTTTRGWDPGKIPGLEKAIQKKYGVAPLWFGGAYIPDFEGRPLTLRENIALLTLCDVGIGVLSGPLHFAAAVGLPTLTLYADQPLYRAAPAYFLNRYIDNPKRWHRTLMGPDALPYTILKSHAPSPSLTPAERTRQNYKDWVVPGRQATKSPLAVITVDEVMAVLQDMISPL